MEAMGRLQPVVEERCLVWPVVEAMGCGRPGELLLFVAVAVAACRRRRCTDVRRHGAAGPGVKARGRLWPGAEERCPLWPVVEAMGCGRPLQLFVAVALPHVDGVGALTSAAAKLLGPAWRQGRLRPGVEERFPLWPVAEAMGCGRPGESSLFVPSSTRVLFLLVSYFHLPFSSASPPPVTCTRSPLSQPLSSTACPGPSQIPEVDLVTSTGTATTRHMMSLWLMPRV